MACKARSRLNDLPDHLLCRILSNLSTKDSIRSSVLSKRWRNLWLDVPVLDLVSSNFGADDDFVRFIDRFLDEEHKLDMEKFKILYYYYDEYLYSDDSYFYAWIDELVKRRVCDLDVQLIADEVYPTMPISLYSCKTLVNLSLSQVNLNDRTIELMPSVKTIHLDGVRFDLLVLETLISNCPTLEKLTIIRDPNDDYLEDVVVRSNSLKRFILETERVEDRVANYHSVEIDAPRLEHMSVYDHLSGSFTIQSIAPLALVNIDVSFDVEDGYSLNLDDDTNDDDTNRSMIRNFLTAISKVSGMKISSATLEVIHDYSRVELLPQFSNLSRLHTSFLDSSWKLLPTFLGCCPNLRSLVVEFESQRVTKQGKLLYVPTPCFESSLEFVRLRTPVMKNSSSQMELARYFLKNCIVLKELSLSESFSKIIKRIEKIPRKPTSCKIVMGSEEPELIPRDLQRQHQRPQPFTPLVFDT